MGPKALSPGPHSAPSPDRALPGLEPICASSSPQATRVGVPGGWVEAELGLDLGPQYFLPQTRPSLEWDPLRHSSFPTSPDDPLAQVLKVLCPQRAPWVPEVTEPRDQAGLTGLGAEPLPAWGLTFPVCSAASRHPAVQSEACLAVCRPPAGSGVCRLRGSRLQALGKG